MTPDERNLLHRFLQDLIQTRGVVRDAEAEGMINQALQSSPTAAYVLVQHAIMSDQALHAAQDQIAALQNQMRAVTPAAPQSASYFPAQQQSWMPAPAAQYVGSGPFNNGGGLGSFIRNAGQMAVGVAAGDLLFEGISGLFGN